jgi:hypothetical protein
MNSKRESCIDMLAVGNISLKFSRAVGGIALFALWILRRYSFAPISQKEW